MVGKKIRHIRELKDFTQKGLSKELGISQKQLSRIESGEVSPTLNMLKLIAEKLDISLRELLDFDETIIFNNNPVNQQGGEYLTFNNTAIKQVQDLYERLLQEKNLRIERLEEMIKNLKPN